MIEINENIYKEYKLKVKDINLNENNIIKDEYNKKFFNENSWNDSNIFYREYMSNPSTDFFVNMDDVLPDFSIASEIVKKAGGMVFLPHIFEYRENYRHCKRLRSRCDTPRLWIFS